MSRLARIRELWHFDNRIQLILDRVAFKKTNLQVYRKAGFEMIVDHRGADAGSIRGCISGEMYKQFLAKMALGKNLRVADFGANVGGFACLLRIAGLDVTQLMCVEMNPNTYERLRFNIYNNYQKSAVVVNAAVCSDNREFSIPLGIGSTGDNIYAGHNGGQATAVHRVRGRTFDDLCNMYLPDTVIDICKIDVEGAEEEFITETSSTISALSRVHYVLIEMHPVHAYESMLRTFEKHGFKLVADEGKKACGVHLFQNVALAKPH